VVYAGAAERFRAALQHALPEDDRADAAFGLVRVGARMRESRSLAVL
jgi:hypothetical protein